MMWFLSVHKPHPCVIIYQHINHTMCFGGHSLLLKMSQLIFTRNKLLLDPPPLPSKKSVINILIHSSMLIIEQSTIFEEKKLTNISFNIYIQHCFPWKTFCYDKCWQLWMTPGNELHFHFVVMMWITEHHSLNKS